MIDMKLKETIDRFLELAPGKSAEVYGGKIKYFYDFLVEVKGINDDSYQLYLAAMSVTEIIESLDRYIEKKEITKTSVALHYISVVRHYFNFLYRFEIANNEVFKSFSYKIQEFVTSDQRLAPVDVKEPLSFDEIKLLLIECDQQVDEALKNNQMTLYNKISISQYNDLMAAIIMKLMAFTGIKFKVINTISIRDLDINHNTICINNYKIHLPDHLADQIGKYLEVRLQVKSDADLLFIKADGNLLGRQSSILAERMEGYIGRSDTTGITKFGVIEMIKNGVNQSILQEFTGVGNDIFKDCQQRVYGEKNEYASRYLDSKLRGMEINDMM